MRRAGERSVHLVQRFPKEMLIQHAVFTILPGLTERQNSILGVECDMLSLRQSTTRLTTLCIATDQTYTE